MSLAPPHVCDVCGCLNDRWLEALGARDEQIASLQRDLDNLQHEFLGKLRAIKRLKRDQLKVLRASEHYSQAMDVLEHWKAVCAPAARELGGVRLENCLLRLQGSYTPAELKRSCDGYALKPYVVNGRRTHEGPKDCWQADAELIFRDPKHVDAGLRIAAQADDLRTAGAAMQTHSSERCETLERLSSLGEAALRIASKGFAVFPCHAHAKSPATTHGVLDAKRDEDTIRRCWSAHPDLNIGIATGVKSGIIVLDVDTADTDDGKDGLETLMRLEDVYGDLPTTLSVKTPRGGLHYYFRHPGPQIQNTAGFPGKGLDIRGDGGYVLAPPSIGPNGHRYEVDEESPIVPMPSWLLKLIFDYQKRQASPGTGRDWARFISEGASQGERDNRMTQFVGHLFVKDHPADEVLAIARILNANVRPPLTERDLQRIVRSIAGREARKAA